MVSPAPCFVPSVGPNARLEVLFEELAELTGQLNAIHGRIVEITAEIDGDRLWGATGCASVAALVAWKTGLSPHNAETVVAIAQRLDEFPVCVAGMLEGRYSLDQVGVIAARGADGSDQHYANLADNATVTQLREAIKLAPKPEGKRPPWQEPKRSITKREHDDGYTTYRITLPKLEAAKFDAALQAKRDAQIADWKRDHGDDRPDTEDHGDDDHGDDDDVQTPPFPVLTDAFMALVDTAWDTEVAARPHGQRTTVIVHVDLAQRIADLHLGPLLSAEERQYLTCDATCEVWFERHGQVVGSGRATRTIGRRLRRALEQRDRCCVVPGCGATRGLHAHHLVHWEDGGPTELWNLVLLCPFHHRAHHRGLITLTGPAHQLVVTDRDGKNLEPGSLARTPTTPRPIVAPCRGPSGERMEWWWYDPFQPQPPPNKN